MKLRRRQPENSRRTHSRVPALQTPPKFHEKTHNERGKRAKLVVGDGKKNSKIWAPHPSGPHIGANPRPLGSQPERFGLCRSRAEGRGRGLPRDAEGFGGEGGEGRGASLTQAFAPSREGHGPALTDVQMLDRSIVYHTGQGVRRCSTSMGLWWACESCDHKRCANFCSGIGSGREVSP